MKEDLSRYDPNIAQVLEETTPEQIKERRRKAVQKLVDEGVIDRETPSPEAHPDAETRTSAPSPWAKEGGAADAGLDPSALPSALVPAGPPVEERPVTKRVGPVEAVRRQSPRTWKFVLACMAVGLLMPVLVVLAGWRMTVAGKVAVSESAAPVETAVPGVAVVPSAAVMPSATAMPTAAVTASAAPSGPPLRRLPVKQHEPHGDPAPTAAPVEPPPPRYFE